MAIAGVDDKLTDEELDSFLNSRKTSHNDSVLKSGETLFDFFASPEADFRNYPEGEMIAKKLAV